MTNVMDREQTTGSAGSPKEPVVAEKVVKLDRKTIDRVLVALGLVVAVVLAVAGGLLTWGANFSDDYVYDELSSQQIFFSSEEALAEEGRDDLVKYAGEQVTTGKHAEAYASFIDGHLPELTYAEQGAVVREARGAVTAAQEAGAPEAEVAELQATLDAANAERDTTFKGETLRGLLLSAYAWSTIGQIAGLAAIAAFIGSGLMFLLVVLGLVHIRRLHA